MEQPSFEICWSDLTKTAQERLLDAFGLLQSDETNAILSNQASKLFQIFPIRIAQKKEVHVITWDEELHDIICDGMYQESKVDQYLSQS